MPKVTIDINHATVILDCEIAHAFEGKPKQHTGFRATIKMSEDDFVLGHGKTPKEAVSRAVKNFGLTAEDMTT